MKRLLVGIGLAAWGIASLTCLGVGIYGGVTQETTESRSLAVMGQASRDNVPAVVEQVVVVPPAPVQEPLVVTDNTPCGAGCVRASFTVVNK